MLEALLGTWPLGTSLLAFFGATLMLVWVGNRLSTVAMQLAHRLRLGQALGGAIFLGATTSIPELIVTVTASLRGEPSVAVGDSIGAIVVQFMYLAVLADLIYRRKNLEAGVRSPDDLAEGALLIVLLALLLLAVLAPSLSLSWISPFSLLLPAVYLGGLILVRRIQDCPGWEPTERHHVLEPPGVVPSQPGEPMGKLWFDFLRFGFFMGCLGWIITRSGVSLGEAFGLSETLVGSFLIAHATAMPELVTVLAAARLGAPSLAIGDIVGGSAFNTLFPAVADFLTPQGPVYPMLGPQIPFLIGFAILVVAIQLLGLLRRQEHGFLNIGFEGGFILLAYLVGYGIMILW